MEGLSREEYEVLKYLLAKVENRHKVMALLIEVVKNKYQNDKDAALALGYSLSALKAITDNYVYYSLH
jgi:hypothetical protein